jgi:hypothetical protein
MPVTPANQFFAQSQLANNPFLSSLIFFQQRQQDALDRKRMEEQQAFENEQAKEALALRKSQLELDQERQKRLIEQDDLSRRMADFQFRTGQQNIPDAILSGSLPTPTVEDPIRSALADIDRTGNVSRQRDPISQFVTNPITGAEQEITPDFVASLFATQDRAQQQKMAIPLLQMEYAFRRDQANKQSQAERDALNNERHLQIAQWAHEDRVASRNLQRELAQMRMQGSSVTENASSLKVLSESGLRATGVPEADELVWGNMSGMDRQILTGQVKLNDVIPAKERAAYLNDVAKMGMVVPNFDPKALSDYKAQKAAAVNLVELAEQFGREAPAPNEGIFANMVGEAMEKWLRHKKDPSIATIDALRGQIEQLKGLTGQTGVLTNQDVARLEGLIPSFTDTAEIRRRKVENLKKALNDRENAFFGSIPTSQRNFIFQYNGIPNSFKNNQTYVPGKSESDALDNLPDR